MTRKQNVRKRAVVAADDDHEDGDDELQRQRANFQHAEVLSKLGTKDFVSVISNAVDLHSPSTNYGTSKAFERVLAARLGLAALPSKLASRQELQARGVAVCNWTLARWKWIRRLRLNESRAAHKSRLEGAHQKGRETYLAAGLKDALVLLDRSFDELKPQDVLRLFHKRANLAGYALLAELASQNAVWHSAKSAVTKDTLRSAWKAAGKPSFKTKRLTGSF